MDTSKHKKSASENEIPSVILPEGYNGKILLVSVRGSAIGNIVVLRSGDLWHREILRNTENEIRGLGFADAQVHALGGALVRFEADGGIVIYDSSHEFGACDKEFASGLIKAAFPSRRVEVGN